MTREEAQEIWDMQIRWAAGEWRAVRGRGTIDENGSSGDFVSHCYRAFADMGDEVKAAIDISEKVWLSREFRRAVEAEL